ncbi:MAG: transposase [Candidatus Schekmanbacteria bacterium]|nr:transposase [Candidatus Schekmanbacteria bacterium]
MPARNHAELLVKRAPDLPPPIQNCDALSRNSSRDFKTTLANCLARARRPCGDLVESFLAAVAYVVEAPSQVYEREAETRRLVCRRRNAWPSSAKERSGDGRAEDLARGAIFRTESRTRFPARARHPLPVEALGAPDPICVPGAPLDNNGCERALKVVVLHRKNALFYKTERSAHVGDVFMGLIHTAELCGVNPSAYLVDVHRHRDAARNRPQTTEESRRLKYLPLKEVRWGAARHARCARHGINNIPATPKCGRSGPASGCRRRSTLPRVQGLLAGGAAGERGGWRRKAIAAPSWRGKKGAPGCNVCLRKRLQMLAS